MLAQSPRADKEVTKHLVLHVENSDLNTEALAAASTHDLEIRLARTDSVKRRRCLDPLAKIPCIALSSFNIKLSWLDQNRYAALNRVGVKSCCSRTVKILARPMAKMQLRVQIIFSLCAAAFLSAPLRYHSSSLRGAFAPLGWLWPAWPRPVGSAMCASRRDSPCPWIATRPLAGPPPQLRRPPCTDASPVGARPQWLLH